MNSKERVIRTITFDHPDRIPVNTWTMPSAINKYGKPLTDVIDKYSTDFGGPYYISHVVDDNKRLEPGTYKDGWGCVWTNYKRGIVGEVKEHPLADYSCLGNFKAPKELLRLGMEKVDSSLAEARDKFLFAPWGVDIFERMQFLRGTENLFMDIMEESDEFLLLRDIVFDFYREFVKIWLERDIDGFIFADDWGTQKSLLIPPRIFRKIFKPMYRELMDMARQRGKYVFFHSDGYIMEIYDDLVELGVNAINSQIWCMDIHEISRKYRGRITFWGEISRQTTLPFGSPEDVRNAAGTMKSLLMHKGGGLIGTASPGDECPLENILESITCWNEAK